MPSRASIDSHLRKAVWYALDNQLYPTAVFTAERLVSEDDSDLDNYYLLVLCHYRMGKYKTAMHIAGGSVGDDGGGAGGRKEKHLGICYVYAQCMLKLGKYRSGCRALERLRTAPGIWPTGPAHLYSHSETERQYLPDVAAVECLLGHLYREYGDSKRAVDAYSAALKINPFLWEAFDGLCRLGVNMRVENIYHVTPAMLAARANWLDNPAAATDLVENSQNWDPFTATPAAGGSAHGPDKDMTSAPVPIKFRADVPPFMARTVDPDSFATPTASGSGGYGQLGADTTTDSDLFAADTATPIDQPRMVRARSRSSQITDAPRRPASAAGRHGRGGDAAAAGTRTASQQSTAVHSHLSHGQPGMASALPTRRSSRLHASGASAMTGTSLAGSTSAASTAKAAGGSRMASSSMPAPPVASSGIKGRLRTGFLKTRSVDGGTAAAAAAAPAPAAAAASETDLGDEIEVAHDDVERIEAEKYALQLFSVLASGFFALSRYECAKAIKIFDSLPATHRDSPWVLAQIGRANFEIVKYQEAEQVFQRLREIDPTRVQDMEIYSTLLWHLHKDVELSFLAHELVDIDRASPQAWCAIGNSFSLQKDHSQALKCFRRAAQLDPTFAYAYTLQGHEYASCEEYQAAQSAFRLAMRAEWRHYNAWYGLGMVFLKVGKFEVAEQHFRQAAAINPCNAVLLCCIGTALEKLRRFQEALEQYKLACEFQPKNALARFRKARLLVSLRQYPTAMEELTVLKDLAPDESNVHFLLGRLYKIVGDKPSAIRHFTTALNLDPKASHLIRDAIESLEAPAN
ncbi:uncharacterized protein V1510DRAFT_181190 [Dipodascopsis tothii]|uniref:uncharacterized protein n=1 Tax=Dipodascopsis tothii TaxID=44089 RepID=UPI0034CF0BAD